MFYDQFHHAQSNDHAPRGWASSPLAYESAMAVMVSLIVVTAGAVLFLPLWVR